MLYSAGVCVSPAVGHSAKLGFVGNVFSKQGWLRFASFWFGSSEQLIVYQSREGLKLLEIKAEYRLAAFSQQQMPDTYTHCGCCRTSLLQWEHFPRPVLCTPSGKAEL